MIAEASVTIEELEREIRAANERRYAFRTYIAATDRVLWRLEELNMHGVLQLPAGIVSDIRKALRELPTSYRRVLKVGSVQKALDSIFDMQNLLFRAYGTYSYPDEEEEGEEA